MPSSLKEKAFQYGDEFADWLRRRWTHIVVPVAVSVFAAMIVQSPFFRELPEYRPGEIARSDIRAPSDLAFINDENTKKNQLTAEQNVLSVYDVDSQIAQGISSRIKQAFTQGRNRTTEVTKESIEKTLGIKLDDSDWRLLTSNAFSRRIQSGLESLIQDTFQYWITETPVSTGKGLNQVVLRDLLSEKEEQVLYNDLRLRTLTLEKARQRVDSDGFAQERALRRLTYDTRASVRKLAKKLIDTNLSFNQIETNARREEARKSVEPVVEQIKRGQMLLREGDKIERRDALLLDKFKSQQTSSADFRSFIGFAALLFILIFVFNWVGARNFKKFRMATRDRLVLGSFFIGSVGLTTGLYFLFEAAQYSSVSSFSIRLLVPLAFAGMTLRLFTSIEITSFFTFLFALCVARLTNDPYLGLVTVVVNLGGAAAMRHISQRLDVVKAGFFAGVIQAICISLGVIMNLTESTGIESNWLDLLATVGFCIASGIIASAVVLVTQPIIEFVGYTTDLRLMELSNTNHPLLRELIMKAPGSYFHSFAVSQLSEKAAEAINANPLFARVASLYHDVGKLKKPQYFIENIQGENKHDKMVPSMSSLIIANHVKEGIELAHSHKLPQSIVDCIPQHHGTSLISYFYEKAKRAAEESGEAEEVDERDFRYPGPKPQTKEAAIIMCADAVEATAKSMQKASPDQLRQSVNATIRRFFLDGQLDECDLSLKDLTAIGNAFVNVLQGIYHQRIDYPHLKKEKVKDATKALAQKKHA